MADTKPNEVQQPEPKAPVAPAAEVKDTTIPKERLDQEIAKRKGAEEALAAREAALAEREKEIAALKNSKPADAKPQPADIDELRKVVQGMQDSQQRQALMAELNLQSSAQAEKVQEILKKAPGLSLAAAHAAAVAENAELFGGKDQRGFIPGQHASLRPTLGGGPPAPPSIKEQSLAIAKNRMVDPKGTADAEKKLHGELLLDALRRDRAPGWS